MKEKIITTVLREVKEVIKNAESFILKYNPTEQRKRKIWESVYDEIDGMILITMSLLDCEIEDYPITKLQDLQYITIEKAQNN